MRWVALGSLGTKWEGIVAEVAVVVEAERRPEGVNLTNYKSTREFLIGFYAWCFSFMPKLPFLGK